MRALLLALALLLAAAPLQARPMLPGPPRLRRRRGPNSAPQQQADLAVARAEVGPHAARPPRAHPASLATLAANCRRKKQQALREGRRNFSELSPRQRKDMRESLRALRALPPEEQQRLRAIWRGMTPGAAPRMVAPGRPAASGLGRAAVP